MDEKRILDLFSLDGKVAIVTGGAGRLGKDHIEILAAAGAKVCSFDIVKNRELPSSIVQYVVDITNQEDVKRGVEAVLKWRKRVDILINNAALNPRVGKDATEFDDMLFAPYEDVSSDVWNKEIAVGLSGAHFCSQAVAPIMIERGKGCIVNIASTSAVTAPDHRKYEGGRFKSAAYPVVKTALLGLTRTWASYFASRAPGVRVNSVSFGSVNFGSMEPEFLAKLGERNMLGRPALPGEYQGTILYLCSDASTFMTASNLVVDAGQTAW